MSFKVPWIDLSTKFVRKQSMDAIHRVLQSGQFVGGAEVERLESSMAEWMHRSHAVALSSGSAALELGLQVMGIQSGDEVIVPAVSFFSSLGAVLRAGATPVVVDTLPSGPWIDPLAAAQAVGPKTKAVIPVHLYGTAAPPLDIGVPVFDDACQAACPGGPSYGALTALSFYPTKTVGGVGDGGMLLTDDFQIAERVRRLRNHGFDAHGEVVERLGTNARMDALKAAVLFDQLSDIDAELDRRRSVAVALDGVVGHRAVPRSGDGPVSVYAFCHEERDRVAGALRGEGIATAVYYPRMIHEHAAVINDVRVTGPLPNASRYCRTTLSVPCHGGLTGEQVAHMVRTLERIV